MKKRNSVGDRRNGFVFYGFILGELQKHHRRSEYQSEVADRQFEFRKPRPRQRLRRQPIMMPFDCGDYVLFPRITDRQRQSETNEAESGHDGFQLIVSHEEELDSNPLHPLESLQRLETISIGAMIGFRSDSFILSPKSR
ncbi:hypothetical protein NE237_026536 [Protea cynaroides]|uniref:Uncharacterized protein n=1 Tax=Protea cynaroides TaxID=273540 RepID=A0A9Q0H796_9MAGN|nr:hypothetical protein NE237_026536 [Protea cynaroides]